MSNVKWLISNECVSLLYTFPGITGLVVSSAAGTTFATGAIADPAGTGDATEDGAVAVAAADDDGVTEIGDWIRQYDESTGKSMW